MPRKLGKFGLPVDDWQLYAKMQTPNFLFGIQHWSTKESGNVPLVVALHGAGFHREAAAAVLALDGQVGLGAALADGVARQRERT